MGGKHNKFQDMNGLAEVARSLEQDNTAVADATPEKPPKSRKKKKAKDSVAAKGGAVEQQGKTCADDATKKDPKKEKKRKKIESKSEGASGGLSDAESSDDDQDVDAAGMGKEKTGLKKESKKKKKKKKVTAAEETSEGGVGQEMDPAPSEPESDQGIEWSEWVETTEKDDDATFRDIYRKMFKSAFGSELTDEENTGMKALMNKSVEVFAEDMSAPFKRLSVESMKPLQSRRRERPPTDFGRLPFESAYSWL